MATSIGSFAGVPTAAMALPSTAVAWNIPGHMLSGAIAYLILRRESVYTIESVKTILEKHPWYETHWKSQLEKLPSIDRDEMLFMLASRWADDVRTRDRVQYHNEPWRYVNWPFKPEGQPATVQPKPPALTNVQTALAANEKSARGDPDPQRRHEASVTLTLREVLGLPAYEKIAQRLKGSEKLWGRRFCSGKNRLAPEGSRCIAH